MNNVLAPRPLHPKKWRKLPRLMMTGSDRQRDFFANAKCSLNKGVAKRREMAQKLAAQKLEIPKEKGFLVLDSSAFPETEQLTQMACERVESFDHSGIKTRKAQLKQGFIDMNTLTLDSPYMKFALRPDVLTAVSRYLGVVPILVDVDVWQSTYPGTKEYEKSQLYHCDAIDVTQMKIFLYASAVEEEAGPLVVMEAASSQELRDKLDYKFTPARIRVSDKEVEDNISAEHIHPIIGEAGTWAFVDTARCFHYGSRCDKGAEPRIVAVFEYYTPGAFVFPIDYRKKAPLKHLATPELEPIQRLALGIE